MSSELCLNDVDAVKIFYFPYLILEEKNCAAQDNLIQAEILRGSFVKQLADSHDDIDITQIIADDSAQPAINFLSKHPKIPPEIHKLDGHTRFYYECWPKTLVDIRALLDAVKEAEKGETAEDARLRKVFNSDIVTWSLFHGHIIYKKGTIADPVIEQHLNKLQSIDKLLGDWRPLTAKLKEIHPRSWQQVCDYIRPKNKDISKQYYD